MGMIGGGVMFGQITFQKFIGGPQNEQGTSAQKTSDGGYIIAGLTGSYGAGWNDFYLIKTNANGDTLWTRTFGGNSYDEAYSVKQTTDGGYIVCGFTETFGPGAMAIYVVKTDSNGNLIWSKTYGGAVDDVGLSIQQTSDGNYIIAGSTTSFGAGTCAIYLIKIDVNGNILWEKTYGGVNSQTGCCVQQTIDGGFVILGYTTSFGAGGEDLYLIKTDSAGGLTWSKTYGGAGNDEGSYVIQALDSGYILIGSTWSFGAGSSDLYLVKTDVSGNLMWSKTYGGYAGDMGTYIEQTSDNGYIITGETMSFGFGLQDVYLIKTNSIGDTAWTKTYGGTGYDVGNFVAEISDGGYFIAGVTDLGGNNGGGSDVYLIKTDSLGNSGCNQTNPATMISTPTTLVSSPTTIVSSGGSAYNPATLVSSGGRISIPCSNSCDTPAVPGPISGNTLVCYGSVQTYTIDSVPNATSYIWTLPTGWTGSSTSTSITVTVDTPSANISVVSQNSCSISTTTRTLVVSVVIAPNQPGPITGADTLCSQSTATYSIAPVAGATSYTWTLPTGWTGTSTTNSITATAGNAGTGYIIVTANDTCGISPPDSFSVFVFICTGINSPANGNGITLYPNPNDGNFTISQLGIRNYELGIMDMTGRVVYSKAINNQKGTETISLPLCSGIYYWEMKTEDGIAGKGKLVIINE